MNKIENIQSLIKLKSDLQSRLNLLPYDGTPEIKEISNKKYLYVRKRVLNKVTSTYVGLYSDELYNILIKNNKEAKDLKKQIRQIEKELLILGYEEGNLSKEVLLNIDFARINLKVNIYNQAVLEGVDKTFPQTEEIIDNGIVSNMNTSDIQKIINLKHAWEFILDKDVLGSETNLDILTYIAKIVNDNLIINGGMLRQLPVTIGGTNYIPPIPNEEDVKENIYNIINSNKSLLDKAIELCLYLMRTQVFLDGNKRVSVLFANYYLIKNAGGLLVIPYKDVSLFKKLLVKFYETYDIKDIKNFMLDKCYKNLA